VRTERQRDHQLAAATGTAATSNNQASVVTKRAR
jgi:hypothetical protein